MKRSTNFIFAAIVMDHVGTQESRETMNPCVFIVIVGLKWPQGNQTASGV